MKYNVGDKFIAEIESVRNHDSMFPYVLETGLAINERYLEKIGRLVKAPAEESLYNKGLEDAWKIATMIYKSSYYGGLKGFEVKKYFGCTIDEIYKLPIQEVVKGFKHYEEDQNLDWSKVPVDTPILVRDDEDLGWEKRHFAKYEDGKIYTWELGRTSWSTSNAIPWNMAKLQEE